MCECTFKRVSVRLHKSFCLRVANFACPRVLDDQKLSEDNQKLRSGCPPHYQKFGEKYFEDNSFRILFSPFPFPTNIYIVLVTQNKLHIIWYSNEGNQIYVEDNQISNFGCPPTTNIRFEFCYPVPSQLVTGNNVMQFLKTSSHIFILFSVF